MYIYIGQYYDNTDRPLVLPYKKIGKSIDVPKREYSLNSTKGPIGYLMIGMWLVGADYEKIERALLAILDNTRVRGEWFIDEDESLFDRVSGFMEKMSYEYIPTEAESAEGRKKLKDIIEKTRSANINLQSLDLKDGDILTFSKDRSITAIVRGPKEIEYQGELTSLSKSAQSLLGATAPVQGSIYWEYDERKLNDIRIEMENNGTYGAKNSDGEDTINPPSPA